MSSVDESPQPSYALRSWIDRSLLVCEYLAGNPLAGDFLEANPSMVQYNRLLAANPSAFNIILKTPEKFCWGWTSANPRIVELLSHNEYNPVSYSIINDAGPHNPPKKAFDQLLSSSSMYWESFDKAFPSICKESENIFRIEWRALSRNPEAVSILVNNLQSMYFWEVSKNKNIAPIFEKYIDVSTKICASPANTLSLKDIMENALNQFNWSYMSANPSAIDILSANPKYIDYATLSANPNPRAMPLLESHVEKIDWVALSANPNPKAMPLLESHMEKIDWTALSSNPAAGKFLKASPHRIVWRELSANPCDAALSLLEASPDRIYWPALSRNTAPRALVLLSNNLEMVDWAALSLNPGIFSESPMVDSPFAAMTIA
jgi:hypothetical protein